MNQRKLIASLVVNGLVFLFTTISVVMSCTVGTGTDLGQSGLKTFQFFTTLSNVYCALVGLILFICEVKRLRAGRYDIPRPLLVLKHTATTAVAVTLVLTICMVAPRDGALWYQNFMGTLFFLHFFNPVLAIVSFIFLEGGRASSPKESLLSLIPVFCYCVLYFSAVVVFQVWTDFYSLTFGGRIWASAIAVVVVLVVTYLLSLLLSFLHKRRWAKIEKA